MERTAGMADLVITLILFLLAIASAADRDFGYAVTFAFLAIGLIAYRRKRLQDLSEERWKNMRARLEALEADLHALRATRAAEAKPAETAVTNASEEKKEAPRTQAVPPARPAEPIPIPPKPVEVPKPAAAPTIPPRPTVAPVSAPKPIVPPAPSANPPERPYQPPVVEAPPQLSEPVVARVSSPVAAPEKMTKPKQRASFEEIVGTNWLPKLGVVLIVGGLVSLLVYKWSDLTPAVKLLLGFVSGGAMLGGGIFLDRQERYRLLARSLIGGGWAAIFFTTFAMYHIPATRVLSSPVADLVLMMIAAVAMVAHTLRYRSQVATGFAFLLGFVAVALNAIGPDGYNVGVSSLAASVVLMAGLVAVVLRMEWYELEVLGIVATYLNHYYWLRPIIEPMAGRHHPFPQFLASAVIVVLYWAVFRASYILRRITTNDQERVSTIAALLNSFFLLGVMKYQSVHPELAFWFLLGLGAIELGLGLLPIVRRRRTAFVLLVTIGVTLLVAAMPFRYADQPSRWAVLWLVEAEALFLAGVWSREIVFRRLAMLTAFAAAFRVLVTQQYSAPNNAHQAIVFGLAAAIFYFDTQLVPRRAEKLVTTRLESTSMRVLAYVAAVMAFAGLWVALPDAWLAVGWAAVALLLAITGERLTSFDLGLQAHAFATAAFLRVLAVNLELPPATGHLRLITVAAVAALLYLCAGWSSMGQATARQAGRALHNSAAALLVALLISFEAPHAWIAPAWIGVALVWAMVGRRFNLPEVSVHGSLLAVAAFFSLLVWNFDLTQTWHGVTLRLATILLSAAGFYLLAAFNDLPTDVETHRRRITRASHTSFAAILVTALLWYELQPIGIALGWMLFGLVLFEFGAVQRLLDVRLEGYAVLAASFVRMFFANLNAQPSPATYTVIPLAVAYFYVYTRLDGADDNFGFERALRTGPYHAYLGTIAVVALLRSQAPTIWVTAAWAATVLALAAATWLLHRRIFLHQALLLTVGISIRGVLLDLQQGSPQAEAHFHPFVWAIALLFAALVLGFRLRRPEAPPRGDVLDVFAIFDRRPEQFFFFAPLALLTYWLAIELQQALVTVAWGVEGVVVFLFALWVAERSFRLAGLGLLLLCVGKIVVLDVWRLQGTYRALTFTVLGCALLLVSSLYVRHKDVFRRIL